MTDRKRFGLRLILWVAAVVLRNQLTDKEMRDLEALRTHFAVSQWEDAER